MSAHKKGKKKSRGKEKSQSVSSTAVIYRGPIVNRSEKFESDLKTVLLPWDAPLTSTSGGVIQNILSSDPSQATDYANLATTYSEYRVLGLEVQFYPSNRYSKVGISCNPLATVLTRRDNPGSLGSYAQAGQYASLKMLSLEDPWKRTIKMDGIEDAGFNSTSSPGIAYAILLYSDGLTNSTTYGRILSYFLVQFRGKF